MEEDKIIFANSAQRSNLLDKVGLLIREMKSLQEQIRKSPSVEEVERAKFEAEWDNCWDTYPAITELVDYAFCGSPSTWAIKGLPFREAPRIVKEAIAKFGKELEQEADEQNSLFSHVAFYEWLENYPVETED